MSNNLLNVALGRSARPASRTHVGEDMAGLSIAGYGHGFAGLHPQTGQPMYFHPSPMATPAGAAMGLSIAGAGSSAQPWGYKDWQSGVKAVQENVQALQAGVQQQLSAIQSSINALSTPSAQDLLQQRKAAALASDRGVLIHDQGGPKRNLLFSIGTAAVVPASSGGVYGTALASGAPQKPFQPHRMIVAGATTAIASGGTLGLLITAMYIGSDLQFVNVPGSQSGVPVDVFANQAFDAKFEFDAAYPAIGITVNLANPISSATTYPFAAAFIGKAIS